ncbi:MAG TPA: nucleotidyl transferase AbiEii/AbiGii toxin family protein [Candidatus Dojkabacteria bacterium]|nr:nucleotidyl transferase AbiEii/AbiGii toxin family protein [Candidatus Dojkabacteria bacterium]HOT61167.1 nucleotidyl transferase AbiEii/AbiGii toxin family protein [Candidatus Dojkabacteria bacterium]HQI92509.1 nucleotidyl transferase AbiEii/AbiGii toxin family protein [Candidatus Dojkabacteria bacterium]
MKQLDIAKHKTILTNILIDIYKEDLLGSSLGFKGGTASMLFYNLPRFSTDLDFDLLNNDGNTEDVIKTMTQLLSKKYDVKEQIEKYNTLFWLVSYGDGLTNIKIEVSTREKPFDTYDIKTLYGIKLKVSKIGDMIANKMVAATERAVTANRDLFDIHFFLSSIYVNNINHDIIKYRTGKEPVEFYTFLYDIVSNIENKNILDGLGEVLNDGQKDWVKSKLKIELLGLIQRQIDMVL